MTIARRGPSLPPAILWIWGGRNWTAKGTVSFVGIPCQGFRAPARLPLDGYLSRLAGSATVRHSTVARNSVFPVACFIGF